MRLQMSNDERAAALLILFIGTVLVFSAWSEKENRTPSSSAPAVSAEDKLLLALDDIGTSNNREKLILAKDRISLLLLSSLPEAEPLEDRDVCYFSPVGE